MSDQTIVADTGPLIAFGRIKKFFILEETLGKIIVPMAVIKECLRSTDRPGGKEILVAVEKKMIVTMDSSTTDHQELYDLLGQGEASAIILALQLNSKLLIDEKLGRKVAENKNLKIIGTLGVLLHAKEKKIIKKIKPILQELKNVSYYFSEELVNKVLLKAKE